MKNEAFVSVHQGFVTPDPDLFYGRLERLSESSAEGRIISLAPYFQVAEGSHDVDFSLMSNAEEAFFKLDAEEAAKTRLAKVGAFIKRLRMENRELLVCAKNRSGQQRLCHLLSEMEVENSSAEFKAGEGESGRSARFG